MSQPKGENITPLWEAERILHPILSPRQPFTAVETSFLKTSLVDQSFALHWLQVVAASNIELAYHFSTQFGLARQALSLKGVQLWIGESLSVYDQEGLYPAVQALKDISIFKQKFIQLDYVCYLEDVKPKLDIFIRGLAGRDLSIKLNQTLQHYTDTSHLYLPASISKFKDKQKNAALYKAMACFLWAQTWYGTFKREKFDSQTTQARLETCALKSDTNTDTAKVLFLNLENIRLLANIERALPGLYREMNLLSPLLIPQDNTWTVLTARLNKEGASVEDTFEVLDILLDLNIPFNQLAYQGGLNLDAVFLKLEARKENIVSKINNLMKDNGVTKEQLQEKINTFEDSQSDTSEAQYSDQSDDDQDDLGALSENTQLNELIQALLQDVESIDLQDFEGTQSHSKEEGDDQSANINLEPEALFFDEWDYVRQNYRKSWCRLNLKPVSDKTEEDFKQLTDEKYPFLISRLKRIFEAMRDQPSMANRQTDGEEIDLDAVVEMHTARRAGEEISERLYIRRQQNKRSVAVCLLVDMSGSTKGWINLAMRESLILFSEALNTLGDEYAIYGFSGLTRQRCEIYDVKHFKENRLEVTQARIGNIQAKDYTRMGVAVRYATEQLIKIPAKHQILLMLSDGKPDDYDGYQGEYGIQDTRKAIVEAQSLGINPFSITIDKQAQLYLPRLFGPSQYMILNDVSMLPLKLSEVYRKLST